MMLRGSLAGLLLYGLTVPLSLAASGSVRPVMTQTALNLPTVVSLNLCTDQLVMLLAVNEQILSLSRLSHEPDGSFFYEKARHHSVNSGTAEAVITLAPDIVLVGPYTSRYTVAMLRDFDVQVEVLPIAGSMEAMLQNVRTVAALLNRHDVGEGIVENVRRRLDEITKASGEQPLTALVYDANGYTSGAKSMRGQLLELAGWSNAASTAGITGYGTLPLETLVQLSPDALIDSPYNKSGYSRAQSLTRHPALRVAGFNPLVVSVAANKTICAGPWSMDVIEQLVTAREELAREKAQKKLIKHR